jgi:hypothetical protein
MRRQAVDPVGDAGIRPERSSCDSIPRLDGNWFEFDIHGYASVRVAANAPSAAILVEILQPFAAEGLKDFDLTVTDAVKPMEAYSCAENRYRYTSTALSLRGAAAQVAIVEGGFHLSGRGELLTRALPLLDIVLARRGAAMIHAAAFEFRGSGIALPAWGGTGKTSAMASLALQSEGAFMSDDWALVAKNERLLGFAKPMFLKPHHRPLYPWVFARSRKPLVPPALSEPMSRLATAVHPAVTRFPRVAAWTRRWSPEHLMVMPRDVFERISSSAPIGAIIFMERSSGEHFSLQEKPADWMAGRLIGNFYAEMPLASRELLTALTATGLVSLPESLAEKHAVLTRAIESKPGFLLRIPRSLAVHQASTQTADEIMKALARCGLA